MEFSRYRVEATLRDGTPVVIRAIRPEDRSALQEGIRLLSDQTVYQRFFAPKPTLTDSELTYLTELDFRNHVGLLAENPALDGLTLIAVARMVRRPLSTGAPVDSAEVAFLVADAYQSRGLGTLLMQHLIIIGRALGFQTLHGEVLPTNRRMLAVLAATGLPRRQHLEDGVLLVDLDL